MHVLSYASILDKTLKALREAEHLRDDAPTPEHQTLVKELRDVVEHLRLLIPIVASKDIRAQPHH